MSYAGEREFAKEQRAVRCDARSRQHRWSYRRWRKRAVALQVFTAGVSAASGSALLAGADQGSLAAIALGSLAILGAMLTAAKDALLPSKTAEEHHRASIRFSALGVAYEAFGRDWRDDVETHNKFQKLEEEHLLAVKEGPEPEQWRTD